MSRRTEARKAAAAGAFAATDAASPEEDGTTAAATAPAPGTGTTTTTAATSATSASKEAGSATATTRGGAMTRGATRGTKRPRPSASASSAAAASPSSSATATAVGRRRPGSPGARPGRKGISRSGGTRGRPPRGLRALHRVSEAVVPRRYRTDLPYESDDDDDEGGGGAKGSSAFASHPSGTIVAPRSRGATGERGGGRGVASDDEREDEEGEEAAAAFVWIEDIRDGPSVATALKSLRDEGYDVRSPAFVPYSSRDRWTERHPRAKLRSASDDGGGSARAASRTKNGKARTSKQRTKDPPKLLRRGALPDAERDQLHREMYDYLVWLRDELARMEGNGKDRRKVRARGISVPALKGLVCKMEATFRGLGSEEDAARRRRGGRGRKKEEEAGGASPARPPSLRPPAGADGAEATPLETPEGTPKGTREGDGGPLAPAPPPEPAREEPRPPLSPLPFLEERLSSELARRVASSSAPEGDGDSPDDAPDAALDALGAPPVDQRATWTRRSFGELLGVLTDHRDREGNAAPPSAHPELGRWVLSLRRNKKRLREAGSEWEPEDEEATTEADASGGKGEGRGEGAAPGADDGAGGGAGARDEEDDDDDARDESGSLLVSNARLSRSRVDALDALGFAWNAGPRRVAWDDRLVELVRFQDENGRFPTNREGSLGGWLKVQRKLYARGDEEFLRTKRRRLEEIGVQLKPNQFTLMSYEDRFQQLVEYGRVNGHYNVPDPVADNPRATMDDLDRDTEEARRFHKWVKKVRAAYRNARRSGGVVAPGDFLTADRVARLREVGFDADAKVKAKSPVPLLDWPTRLRQLEAFRAEVGHLRVDPRYECQSNLGGWAAAASEKHKAWREGTEALDPETAGQFDRLWAMGFRFDVFPVHRGKKEGARSWEDNFELLLRYRGETGNCRVPHGYKADMSLGNWVAVQRKEYKLLSVGKRSLMTQERLQKLNSIGFEWVARQGREHG